MRGRHAFARDRASNPTAGVVVADHQRWAQGWVATSSAWVPVKLEGGQRCNGFAMKYRGLFVAVYASGETVWLQAGSRAWSCNTIARVTQTVERLRGATYDLAFADGSQQRLTLRMPATVVAQRLVEQSYAEVDAWPEDVIKRLPYVADGRWTSEDGDVGAWAHRVLPQWRSGVKHGP